VHLLGRLQVPVGVAFAAKAELVDGAAMTDTGQDVLQQASPGMVEEDVVGDDGRDTGLGREVGQIMQAQRVAGAAAQGQGEVGPIREDLAQFAQVGCGRFVGFIGNEHAHQTLGPVGDIGPVDVAFRLAGAAFAHRQEPGQPRIGGAVRGIDEQACPIDEVEPAADDQPRVRGLRRFPGAHDAGDRVAIDDGQSLDAADIRLAEQLFAGGGAAQEGEVRGGLQFDVARR
jgi:hypothetical protein